MKNKWLFEQKINEQKMKKKLTGIMLAQRWTIFVIKALQSLTRHIDSKTCKQKQYKYHFR